MNATLLYNLYSSKFIQMSDEENSKIISYYKQNVIEIICIVIEIKYTI
jgi:hypothetical protein